MWWLSLVTFIIGGLIGFMAKRLEVRAGKSLLYDSKIKPTNIYRNVNGINLWCVELSIGTGNWLTKFYGDSATVEISPLVWFKGNDGTKIRGLTYKIGSQVVDKYSMKSTFEISRNTKVSLAIAKSSKEDMTLYILGGWAHAWPLDKTYDAVLIIRDKHEREISHHIIKSYIRDGIVVTDKENDYWV